MSKQNKRCVRLILYCLALIVFAGPATAADSVLDRLAGDWVSDIDALNKTNIEQGRPPEPASATITRYDRGHITETDERDQTRYPFYLAGENVWQGDLCRGGSFNPEIFDAQYRSENGNVIVRIDQGEVYCHTIETLTDNRLVLTYLGARLNYHYFKRPDR